MQRRVPDLLFADMPYGTCPPGSDTCRITRGLAALETLPLRCKDNTCVIPTAAAAMWCERVPAGATGALANCPAESRARLERTPTYMCSTPGGGVAFFLPK